MQACYQRFTILHKPLPWVWRLNVGSESPGMNMQQVPGKRVARVGRARTIGKYITVGPSISQQGGPLLTLCFAARKRENNGERTAEQDRAIVRHLFTPGFNRIRRPTDRRFLSLQAARFLREGGIRKILVGRVFLRIRARAHGRDEVITSFRPRRDENLKLMAAVAIS